MEVESDFIEAATPSLTDNNVSFWRTEDSGYHTSITPGSVECSEISNENLEPSTSHGRICLPGHSAQAQVNYNKTPEATFKFGRKYVHTKNVLSVTQYESSTESLKIRHGVKRHYSEDSSEVTHSCVPTPTSMIAGGIQKLKVADTMTFSWSTMSSDHSSTLASSLYNMNDYVSTLSYPTTPVKKICRNSCKLSPIKRSTKKIQFAAHSLSCESNGLVKRRRPHSKVVRTIQFRPDQKIDIMKMLYENARVMPPILKIFSYLNHQDISNFNLVSSLWCQIWNDVSQEASKQDYENFLKNKKENLENKYKDATPKKDENSQMRSLKEVHNVLNAHLVSSSPRSPPGTPRSNKFKKFTKFSAVVSDKKLVNKKSAVEKNSTSANKNNKKLGSKNSAVEKNFTSATISDKLENKKSIATKESASLDSRLQLSCVRCNQPSKVTEEDSGEEWAECTSSTCSFQFCRYCKCQRHPGKLCFQYDLNRPSPSKRKKNVSAVGTKKSRRNLRRLL